MGIKQYLIFLPAFFARNWNPNKKMLILSSLVFAGISLLFIIPDPSKFNVYGLEYRYSNFYNSLTLPSFIFKNFNVKLPTIISYIFWIVISSVVLMKKPKRLFEHYFLIAYWLLAIFFFGNVGFLNEYYLSFTMLFLAYILSLNVLKTNKRAQ